MVEFNLTPESKAEIDQKLAKKGLHAIAYGPKSVSARQFPDELSDKLVSLAQGVNELHDPELLYQEFILDYKNSENPIAAWARTARRLYRAHYGEEMVTDSNLGSEVDLNVSTVVGLLVELSIGYLSGESRMPVHGSFRNVKGYMMINKRKMTIIDACPGEEEARSMISAAFVVFDRVKSERATKI